MKRPSVTVERFYTENADKLHLKLLAGAEGLKGIIREPTVNRPGLALAGFTRYFANKRMQVLGNAEVHFLRSLPEAERERRFRELLAHKIPCAVFCRSFKPEKAFLRLAEAANVPVFGTSLITMKFLNLATLALEALFAPRSLEMGSMVDILGIGVLIRGESGIGKSECVLALIERGYSLVSDDVTRVTLIDGRDVIGSAADLVRNHMEVRGIGIINVAAMFGVKCVRREKKIDLVVTLKWWNDVDNVDRLGIEEQHVEILGVRLPHVILPVRPGRDVARLVEVAAFQAKLRLLGFNAAKELDERLIAEMAKNAPL
jgi:HPr kinase/phosphorylase